MGQPQTDPQMIGIQPQYVMVPIKATNGLGVFGLILAFIGLFIPTGIVAFLGLGVSLVAVGRSPRVAATFGVLLGLLGTLIWLAIDLVAIIAVVLGLAGAAAGTAVAFAITQPETIEITSDMANIALATQHRVHNGGEPPASINDLDLPRPMTIDPWGNPYRLALTARDPGFDIISAGADESFDTEDDVTLATFNTFWKQSLASFEGRMENFGEMLASLQSNQHTFRVDMGDVNFSMGKGHLTILGTCDAGLPIDIAVPTGDGPSTASTVQAISESYWSTAAREVDAQSKQQQNQNDAPAKNADTPDTVGDDTSD